MPQSGDATVYTHPHNYVNPPSTAWMATTADSVGLALAIIVVAARCWTKFRITKAPGWEDCMSACLLVVAVYTTSTDIMKISPSWHWLPSSLTGL